MIHHLLEVARGLMVAAAVVAVVLARRMPTHRPAAALLVAQTAVMLARWALKDLYLAGAIAAAGGDLAAGMQPAPLLGWARAAAVVYNAGWLLDSAILAAAAMWVFADDQRKVFRSVTLGELPFLAWLAASAFIAITYPEGRPFYPHLFTGAQILAVVVGLGSAGTWALRGGWRDGIGITRGCILFAVGCEGVALAGPFAHGVFSSWWLANAVQLVMYSGLIVAQGGALLLWVSRSR